MKKTNFMTAVLVVMAILLLVACTQAPANEETVPSSSVVLSGGVMDNTLFGDGGSNIGSQPSSGATVPPTSVPQPSSGAMVPPTSVPQPSSGAMVPPTSTPQPENPPATSVPQPSGGATVPPTSAPQPTEPPATSEPQPAGPSKEPTSESYEMFKAMTGAEQRAFQNSFESLDAFFEWYFAAKEAYDQAHPSIEVGGNGVVDLGTLPTNPPT